MNLDEVIGAGAKEVHRRLCQFCCEGFDSGLCNGANAADIGIAVAVLDVGIRLAGGLASGALVRAGMDMQHRLHPNGGETLSVPSPEELLIEWFRWWRDGEGAPAKLPDALHVRTAAALAAQAVAEGRKVTGPMDL